MIFIIVGVLLLLLKWQAIGPVATWSWWIVLAPFFFGFIYFEFIEPRLGLDKKRAHSELERVKKERIKKQLEKMRAPRR